jgi:hypothetical protein
VGPSSTFEPPTAASLAQACHFLIEVRRRPDVMARLRDETLDLGDLVALGKSLGFDFDGHALQQAFRNDFQLRLAIQQRTGSTKANR